VKIRKKKRETKHIILLILEFRGIIVTLYEGITWAFIGIGILFTIISFLIFETKKKEKIEDQAMEEDAFRLQISLIDEKILELEDYRKYVEEEMDKKHKELLFLYQMITEKERKIKKLSENATIQVIPQKQISETEEKVLEEIDVLEDRKKQILILKKQGLGKKEIARKLAIGQGEVGLILNLFE